MKNNNVLQALNNTFITRIPKDKEVIAIDKFCPMSL